ncbi:hypothetical protein EON65_45490 [archaeon]|nr:MAG: hypothetical protein EON65_45490 [archaeon]
MDGSSRYLGLQASSFYRLLPMSHKPLPKRLEDDLDNVKYYKGGAQQGAAKSIHENLSRVFDDSAERAMVDELFGGAIRRPSAESILPKIPSTKAPTGQSSSKPALTTDFTTSLLQRLRVVEAEASESRQILSEQIVYNEKLERELDTLRSMTGGSGKGQVAEIEKLRSENQSLKSQIAEMEGFLADYGLVWVGKQSNQPNSQQNALDQEDEAEEDVDYGAFKKAVDDLNATLYAEGGKVSKQSNYM